MRCRPAPSSKTICLVAPFLLLAFTLARPGAAAHISELDRGVLADGSAISAAEYDAYEDDAFLQIPGPFEQSVSGSLEIDQVAGSSSASQSSLLLTQWTSFEGAAEATGTLEALGAEGLIGVTNGAMQAESSLYLTFGVGRTVEYSLAGSFSTLALDAGDASVYISLSERGGDALFSLLRFGEDEDVFESSGFLEAGLDYDLVIEVRSAVLLDEAFSSGFAASRAGLMLTIPEPGTGVLLAMGLSLLSTRSRSKRRAQAMRAGHTTGDAAE